MRDSLVLWREQVMRELGGLSEPEVKNEEWLYLLKRETRHSIMVEGMFVKEEDLESVLFGGNYEVRFSSDVLNYFKVARFMYGLAYENYRGGEFMVNQGLVRKLGYSKDSVRKWVERGKLIAVRRGKTYYSHPRLFFS